MNVEQLQKLSDAELNELSAVKVMGYKLWEETPDLFHPFQGNHDWLEDEGNYPHIIKYQNGRFILWEIPNANGRDWNPTKNMNDAKEILDHFKGMNYDIKINSTISGWCCNIPFVHEGKRFFAIHHDELLTRTISICALLVVGD